MNPLNSLLQFQDLNVSPNVDPSFTPIIIPKQESLDEPLQFPPNPTTGSIFHVPDPETQITAQCDLNTNIYLTRSSELVRFINLTSNDHFYYRNLILKTRRLFDSFSVFNLYEYEKWRQQNKNNNELPRKKSGAIKSATVLRQEGLWMNRDKRIVGNIPGVFIGDVFLSRMELCVIGLHGQVQAGIDYVSASHSSNGETIATSVIVSGGYGDNKDMGNVIIYTGHGGQDGKKKQVSNQKLKAGNLALERSMCYGIEVRVMRGLKCDGRKVYVYDGLYKIVNTWFDTGISGFGVYKFMLVRVKGQSEMGSVLMKLASSLKLCSLEVRARRYVSLDLSKNKERFPVFLHNNIDLDDAPLNYEYLVTTIFPPHVYGYGNGRGCECVAGCTDDCFCAMKNGDGLAYDCYGRLVRGKPLVFECGPHCKCPSDCRNRVTQKGIKNRFEVFRSDETVWGVRSLDLIQAGSFICELAGVAIARELVPLLTMNGDTLIYASWFDKKWKEWGDLSQLFCDYVSPSHPSISPLDFAIDVSTMRNFACYISESSIPNVFVQPVLYDHNNVSFPRLMLFALETIPPMRELSLDYRVAFE